MKVKCKSGLTGWQNKLWGNYKSFEEFESYSETYGLHQRLGFKSAKEAWDANPEAQGSTDPSDFRLAPPHEKPWLRSGATGFINDEGRWVCTGSMMGRRAILPDDPSAPIRLKMERLRFVDGCYDQGGAYWGAPENVWCAYADEVMVTTRADSRDQAKENVKASIPGATFHR